MKISYPFLTQVIDTKYTELGIKVNHEKGSIGKIDLLRPLSDNQKEHLLKGDGQKDDQYRQINSSTGLIVNYLKLLEEVKGIANLDFEVKIGRPLRWGNDANLDAYYLQNETETFVESKFLEPYCNGNETNRQSYFESDKYTSDCKKIVDDWIDLFLYAETFKTYNVAQLCRHLLTIYHYTYKRHFASKVALMSFVWLPSDTFIKLIDDREAKQQLLSMRTKVEKEGQDFSNYLNEFFDRIHWTNITFKAKTYNSNEMLIAIKDAEEFEEFKIRYFIKG